MLHGIHAKAKDVSMSRMKLIGPGEAALRLVRVLWRLARRRPLLAAWLAMMSMTLVPPCLFYYTYVSASTPVIWGIYGGALIRYDSSKFSLVTAPGHDLGSQLDTSGLLAFEFQWSDGGQPVSHPPYFITFPVWIVPAIPTLLIGMPMFIRHDRRRRRGRAARCAGRTPCPECGYDATGLKTCSECGAGIQSS